MKHLSSGIEYVRRNIVNQIEIMKDSAGCAEKKEHDAELAQVFRDAQRIYERILNGLDEVQT